MVTCCKIFHSKIPLYGKVKMTIKGPIVLGSFVIVDLFDCDLTQMGPPKNPFQRTSTNSYIVG